LAQNTRNSRLIAARKPPASRPAGADNPSSTAANAFQFKWNVITAGAQAVFVLEALQFFDVAGQDRFWLAMFENPLGQKSERR
jgi:hypothetical protein